MKVTISSAEMIDYACVEVIGKLGRQRAEFVIYFSRHENGNGGRKIEGGYRFVPEETYLSTDNLPIEVCDAANEVFAKRTEQKNQTKFPMSR